MSRSSFNVELDAANATWLSNDVAMLSNGKGGKRGGLGQTQLRRIHRLLRFLIILKRWVYHLQMKYVCLLKRYFQKLSIRLLDPIFKARVSQEIRGNQTI